MEGRKGEMEGGGKEEKRKLGQKEGQKGEGLREGDRKEEGREREGSGYGVHLKMYHIRFLTRQI